jgi:hypothetical protein
MYINVSCFILSRYYIYTEIPFDGVGIILLKLKISLLFRHAKLIYFLQNKVSSKIDVFYKMYNDSKHHLCETYMKKI